MSIKIYFTTVRAEMTKGKKTFALWLTLLFPLFTVALITLANFGMNNPDTNPWVRFMFNLNNTTAFFLPFFLILLIGYFTYIEPKSNAWKHMLTLPVPRAILFFGKLTMIVLLVLLTFLITLSLGYLSSWLLHLLKPLKFHYQQGGVPLGHLMLLLGNTYLCGLFIIAFQYWISSRFRNLVVPVVIGISLIILPIAVLIILGMSGLIHQPDALKDIFNYDPYSYPFGHNFNFTKGPEPNLVLLPKMSVIYLIASILVSIVAFFDFRRRNF
ncbi:MAG: ABC transporter permease [Bacteroidetes bacterium]|nr:ABC transporter permease [Bacteroidota bacterium]